MCPREDRTHLTEGRSEFFVRSIAIDLVRLGNAKQQERIRTTKLKRLL